MPNLPSPFTPGARIFAYLRDSGHEKQELSISQQENAIRTWAVENGYILHHIYKDEARPGSSIVARTELNAMMNAFRHGAEVAGVVVWKYNRFARNIDNAQFLRAEIRTRGYVLHSINDHIPLGPEAVIFEAIIDYTDQQYLTNLSIDVKRGLRNLVEQFGCVPGVPPTGFKREKLTISHHRDGAPRIAHRWVPDPDLAPRVLRAFQMRVTGASLGQINAETRLFGSINSYRTFFANKIYIGTLVFGDLVIEDYCTPMVDQKTFELVQDRQNNFSRSKHMTGGTIDHPQRVASKYLLSGLAHCARCGAPLSGTTSSQRNGSIMRSYFCTKAYRTRDCTRHRIPVEKTEAAVIEALRERISRPDYLAAILTEKLAAESTQQAEHEAKRRQLNKELASTRRLITNTTAAIGQRKDSRALLKSLDALEAQETQIETDLATLATNHTRLIPEASAKELADQLTRLQAALANSDIQVQRAILRSMVARIDIDREENRIFGVIAIYIPRTGGDPPSNDNNNDPPPPKRPPSRKTVQKAQAPSGPPRYTHSFTFEFNIGGVGRRHKKTHSQ